MKENQIQFALLVFFLFAAFRQYVRKRKEALKAGAKRAWCDAPGFPEIEQLEGFNWEEETPIRLRSFKPKFYLTMGEFMMVEYRPLGNPKLMFLVLTRLL